MFPAKIQLGSILRGDISPYLGINSITNRIKKCRHFFYHMELLCKLLFFHRF